MRSRFLLLAFFLGPLVSVLVTPDLLTAAQPGEVAGSDPPVVEAVRSAQDGSASDAVRRLLDAAAEVDASGIVNAANAAQADGTTATHWAARHDDLETVRLLIDAGADVGAVNRYGVTPLHLAATNGSASVVAALLDAGADPNTASPGGDTILMVASRTGRVDVLRRLIRAGADVDRRENWRNQTALMWAAAEGHAEAVDLLVDAGAEVDARSDGKWSPLLFAVREGQLDAARALLASGADVSGAAPGGSSPLAVAVINAHYELALQLLEAGADPNAADPRGSILHALAWMRRPGSGSPPLPTGGVSSLELGRALLERGADPNRQVDWEEIPFEVDLGVVKLPPGISVGRNFLSFVGATPFYLAAKHADLDLMRLLIEHGADSLTPTSQHVTPLMAASGVGFWDGESPGPNNGTPEGVRLEAVRLALELGNDIHAVTEFGDTAIKGDGVDLLRRHPLNLSEFDPQRDRGDMRWGGSTALHGAAMMGANVIVEFLVEHGARPDETNDLGWTPLMVAEGVFVANTEKAWPETAALIRDLMRQ